MNAFLSADHEVYAYFNNDSGGHAPRNAQVLIRKFSSTIRSIYSDLPIIFGFQATLITARAKT